MANIVKFIETTQEKYNQIESKEPGSLYFTTDTNRLYKGGVAYTQLLTPKYDEWTITGLPDGWTVGNEPTWNNGSWTMTIQHDGQSDDIVDQNSPENALSLTFTYESTSIRANRSIIGYQMGKQEDKTLATMQQGRNADLALASLSYTLGSEITSSATLSDRTNNFVLLAEGNQTINLAFPPALANNKARDFLILVKKTSGFTGSLSIAKPTQNTTIYGDGFDVLATLSDNDVYLISVTEIASDIFYTRAQKMEEIS